MTTTAQALLDASAIVEALRPEANIAIGSPNDADKAIVAAWELALERFRKACAAWIANPG
jgi:hypothetical protein